MMHVQELETIKRHRMNTLIVVINDGAEGPEDAKEEKSLTAKDAEVAKEALFGVQLPERGGIAKVGIQESL